MLAEHKNTSYLLSNEHRSKVLIVEDDPVWQAMLRQSIKSRHPGTEVQAVSSVKKARQIIRSSGDLDFVIADFCLEGKETGLDLWKECESKHRHIPFLLVSGMSEESLSPGFTAGRNRPIYLSKALDIRDLRANLAIALSASEAMARQTFRQAVTHPETISAVLLAAVMSTLTVYAINLHREVNLAIGQNRALFSHARSASPLTMAEAKYRQQSVAKQELQERRDAALRKLNAK